MTNYRIITCSRRVSHHPSREIREFLSIDEYTRDFSAILVSVTSMQSSSYGSHSADRWLRRIENEVKKMKWEERWSSEAGRRIVRTAVYPVFQQQQRHIAMLISSALCDDIRACIHRTPMGRETHREKWRSNEEEEKKCFDRDLCGDSRHWVS